ncbi:TlpA family protein disulfide reductase [Sphingobacterium griseoflavum]|uniref:Thioredoxin domain-containing protein n=1 Tax=Sphingobacterium griseoflavum TaxID=1474952 RepID=A0ABQ3I159_9SPHI|nr:TlpA disulfide reductase family protein [Sphingobacterium griseoflavum]GHE48070.1 hypothetical protein GCM10017764_33910 [Sphingobacterium griseoflavum]
MYRTKRKWNTGHLTVVLLLVALNVHSQDVIFKGNTGSNKYDGYSVILYHYDRSEKAVQAEGKIHDGKFEISAPYYGPGEYLFQNGYELALKRRPPAFAILVDKPGEVIIDANMEALNKSITSGSAPQLVKAEFEQALEKKKGTFWKQMRRKYGSAMVDDPETYEQDAKFPEFVQEWQNFEKQEAPKIKGAILLSFAKRYPNSMAIPRLANDHTLGADMQQQIYSLLGTENQLSRYGKKLLAAVRTTRMSAEGTKLPNFSLPRADGTSVSLDEMLQGKRYLLIDFWASWCAPCRAEFPGMKALYSRYKDRGFEIWGISTDNSKEKWLAALEQERPDWPQTWEGGIPPDKKASGNFFYVPYLPSTYLLDAQGKIVARDLRGQELEKKLSNLFNK